MIIILVLLVVILFNLVCRTQKRLTFYGGEINNTYTFKRYPKFCCDTNPNPMSRKEYNKLISTTTNDDTKFLYKVMTNPNIRVLSFFDDDSYKGKYLYKKKINNISEKQGKNIYYQISIMNDYPTNQYPKKSDYSITVYFIEDATAPNASLITKNFYNTIIASKLFLNKNSIDILKYQDLDNFNSFKMKDSRIMINTYLNLLNEEVSLYEQEYIMALSGVISYILGLRKIKDIDLDIYYKNDKVINTLSSIPFIDSGVIGVPNSKDVMDSLFNAKVTHILKIKNIKNVFTDSNNYFYFLGIKCLSLDNNMKYRQYRKSPKAIAEIIAFNMKNPKKQFKVPDIPSNTYLYPEDQKSYNEYELLKTMFDVDLNTSPINQKEFNKTVVYYLKSLYGIKSIKDIDINDISMVFKN